MLPIRRLLLLPQRSSIVGHSLLWHRRLRLRRGVDGRRRGGVISVRELIIAGGRHAGDIRVGVATIASRCVLSAVPAERNLIVPRVVGVVAVEAVGVGGAQHLDGALFVLACVGTRLVAGAATGAGLGGLKDGDLA